MTDSTDIWATTALAVSPADPGAELSKAVALREQVLRMTQTAEDAVLKPADPGGWPLDLRAALASRVARLNQCPELATHYQSIMQQNEYAAIADPNSTDVPENLKPCLAFIDRAAVEPAEMTEDDIRTLQSAGITDADIVRLSELNAFLAYQVRLVATLSLLSESKP